MHHIVSDGWSLGVLVREVAALYEAYREGRESPLAELEIQYADYAMWQREWLRGEVLDRQLAYWKKQLADMPLAPAIPIDRHRPAVQSYRGASLPFSLASPVTAELKALSQKNGVSLFMTLAAAFKTLLYGYTGQGDVVIGTNIANRNYREIEPLIGFFINNLVLRTNLRGNPPFTELLRRVREVCLGAYLHQEIPYQKVVEVTHPARSLSHQPLFQILFVLQNAPAENLTMPGLSIIPFGVAGQMARYDINFSMAEADGELRGLIEYSTDIFYNATIQRLSDRYRELLNKIADDADRNIESLLNFEDEQDLISTPCDFNDELE